MGKSKGLLFRIDSFFFAYNEHYNLHAIINNQNMLHTAHSPIINRRSEWCSYNVECRMQRGPLLSVCGLVSLPYVCFEWWMHVCMWCIGEKGDRHYLVALFSCACGHNLISFGDSTTILLLVTVPYGVPPTRSRLHNTRTYIQCAYQVYHKQAPVREPGMDEATVHSCEPACMFPLFSRPAKKYGHMV